MTPKEIGAIVTARTGLLCGNFSDFHEYAEKLMGNPIWTHQFADPETSAKIAEAAQADFLRLAQWCARIES